MHVVVNAAMSADGKLSTVERPQVRISGTQDFDRVDQLRAEVDAVMVGIGTVLADDPQLTVKSPTLTREREANGQPPHPARVVADSMGRIPVDAAMLDNTATTHLLVAEHAPDERVTTLQEFGTIDRVGVDQVDVEAGLEALGKRGIDSILVEGGGELIFSLLSDDLVDRLSVYIGNQIIGGRDAPTLADGSGFTAPTDFVDLQLEDVSRLDDGVLLDWQVS